MAEGSAQAPATLQLAVGDRVVYPKQGVCRVTGIDVKEVAGPEEVTRIDGNRSATVNGTATGSDVGATTKTLPDFPELWSSLLQDPGT